MTDSAPVATPYCDFTTPEAVQARDSLALFLAGSLTDQERAAVEWLHAYATEELARRLSGFVAHVDGAVVGIALERLAFDVGIVRGPKSPPAPTATRSRPLLTERANGRTPIPVRGGGRKRG